MDKEWLKIKMTLDEAEVRFPGPKCTEFRRQFQDGDELWTFLSPPVTGQDMCARGGIALVRNGEIVASIVTLVN